MRTRDLQVKLRRLDAENETLRRKVETQDGTSVKHLGWWVRWYKIVCRDGKRVYIPSWKRLTKNGGNNYREKAKRD